MSGAVFKYGRGDKRMNKVAIEHVDNYRLDAVKATLRKCFDDLELPQINPLGRLIKPG